MGAPDMVVVNVAKDWIWVRDGVIPEFPNMKPPTFDMAANRGMVVPAPRNTRAGMQNQSIRDAEIPPEAYYPKGYFAASCSRTGRRTSQSTPPGS